MTIAILTSFVFATFTLVALFVLAQVYDISFLHSYFHFLITEPNYIIVSVLLLTLFILFSLILFKLVLETES